MSTTVTIYRPCVDGDMENSLQAQIYIKNPEKHFLQSAARLTAAADRYRLTTTDF